MTEGLVFLAAALGALTALGLAVLAPVRPGRRAALLPAAPVLGAALLAVVLSSTTWFLSVRQSWLVVALVAVVLVVVGARRGRLAPPSRAAVLVAVGALAAGVPGAVTALRPSLLLGDAAAVSPTQSHDAFYYVAEAGWLLDRPISPGPVTAEAPGPGTDPPAYAPLATSLWLSLRVGQPMVHAALSALVGQDPVRNAAAVTALWVLLVAPAAFVAARLVRVPVAGAAATALVVGSSALLVQQAYQQNVDALLGVSLALLTLAGVTAAARGRTARWPAALLLAALVAVYTEYGLYVGPAVIGGILLTRAPGARRRWRRALTTLGLALVVAPAAWVRGWGTLRIRRDGDLGGSPLFSDGWFAAVSRVVGTSPLGGEPVGGTVTVVLALAVVVGLVAAVVRHRYRGAWIGLLAVGGGHLAQLTLGHHGYTQQRAATLLMPLVLLASAAGWSTLVPRRARTVASRVAQPAAAGLVLVWVAFNLLAVRGAFDVRAAAERHVDPSFAELAEWAEEVGGPDGADVAVAVPDMFDQMWAAYALRDLDQVEYLTLRPDYMGGGREVYWSGAPNRYLVVGSGAVVAPGAQVVESNDRFALLDVAAAPTAVAVPGDATRWFPFAVGDGMQGPDGGVVRVVGGEPGAPVRVELRPDPRADVVGVRDLGTGERWSVPVEGRTAVVELGEVPPEGRLLKVDVDDDGRDGDRGFELIGVDDGR